MTAILKVDEIQDTSGNLIIKEDSNTITVGASGDTVNIGGTAGTGFGKVLQVVQTLKTDTESVTGTSFADITGLNVSITPSSSSSKVLIMLTMTFGGSGDIYPAFKLLRGTTVVTTATDLQGSCISATFGKNAYQSTNTENLSYTFLDSPSTTSATTYKIQVRPQGTTSKTYYLNRPGNTSDANRYQGTTTLTAMEISA